MAKVAFFSHGEIGASPGVNKNQIADFQWAEIHGMVGELYLFGCELGKGNDGMAKMQEIANATGATVYASTMLVEFSSLGVRNVGFENDDSNKIVPKTAQNQLFMIVVRPIPKKED